MESSPLTAENTSRTVATRRWKIHYNEAGDPANPTVVLLHGSGAGATGWSNFKSNIPAFAEHFHVLAVDMPGWGDSDPQTPDESDHVQAAVDLLDALGIEQAAFVGNSMGGITSLALAVKHPERVSHLVTMGPSSGMHPPRLFSPAGPTEGLKVLFNGYLDPTPESMKQLALVMAFHPKFATDELAAERAESANAHPEHIANFAQSIKTGKIPFPFLQPNDFATIKAPTLLIHGRDDRVMSYEHSLALCSWIPDSQLHIFNRCGHWAQLEHADRFNRLVIDFILHN